MAERKKLGDILVEAKVISTTQLQSALAHQRQWGGRLGTALIEKGFVTEEVLAKFLSFQLNFPSVSLAKLQVAPEVLAKIPRAIQEKHLCVPVALVKEGRRDSLVVALADPTDVRAVDEIGFAAGCKVKPVIATETSLKAFLFGGKPSRPVSTPSESSGMITERTGEFELVRGVESVVPSKPAAAPSSTSGSHTPAGGVSAARYRGGERAVGASHVPLGENTIDLDDSAIAPAPDDELVLDQTDSSDSGPPIVAGTLDPAPAPATKPRQAPPPARPKQPEVVPTVPAVAAEDPFVSAVRGRGRGSAPSAPKAAEPVPIGKPSGVPNPPLGLDSFFAGDPQSELGAGQAGFRIPDAPAPAAPAEEPMAEISLPGPDGAAPQEVAPENLAQADTVADQPPPEAPVAPSPLQAPAESPSRVFQIPEDMMIAEPSQAGLPPVEESHAPAQPPAPGLDPAEMERTVLGSGAAEETWGGEPSLVEATAISPDQPEPTGTEELAPPEPSQPGLAPEKTQISAMPPVESSVTAAATDITEATQEAISPDGGPPPMSSAAVLPRNKPRPQPVVEVSASQEISRGEYELGDQAKLNATVTKKLKLLNALVELLLEKGLLTEEELKEKLARKKG